MPSNRRNSPSRAEILESEQKPGVKEGAQKRCHAALRNVVSHGRCGPAGRAHHARCRAHVVPNGHYHEVDAPGDETFHDKVVVENMARVVLNWGQGHRFPEVPAEAVSEQRPRVVHLIGAGC